MNKKVRLKSSSKSSKPQRPSRGALSSSIHQLDMKVIKQVPSVSIQESQAQASIQRSSDKAEARAEPQWGPQMGLEGIQRMVGDA